MTFTASPRNLPGPFGFCSFGGHPIEPQPTAQGFSPAARCPVTGQWYSYSPDGAAWLRMDPVEQRQPRFPLFPEQPPTRKLSLTPLADDLNPEGKNCRRQPPISLSAQNPRRGLLKRQLHNPEPALMPNLRPVQTELHPTQICAACEQPAPKLVCADNSATAYFHIRCAAQRLLAGLKAPANV